jgi:membrane protein YqaA with SNARE-associated domain
MLESLTAFIADYGYLNLFILSFLASTVLPFGSEALVVALVYQGFSPFAVVMVATTGNFLGSCTTYYLGLKGRHVLERYLSPSPEKLEKSERLFNKYGAILSFLPGFRYRGVITMVAGLMQLPSGLFHSWFFLENSGVILSLLIR